MHRIMKTDSHNLYNLSLPELEGLMRAWGQPAYRARQIYRQLYVNLAADPAAMTDLPAALRERLAAETRIGSGARAGIEAAVGRPVFLDLWVKVRPNWRDDAAALKWLGYRNERQ